MKKRYRDILLSSDSGERLELNDAPVGFDDMKFSLLRDMVYLGILKKISIEFAFVGDGYRFMQRHRLKYGVDANIIYRRYENNPNRFVFEGKVNQENYNEDRKLNQYKVDIIQSSFVQKFSNREDVKLNLLNTISCDRRPITQAALKEATIRGKSIQFYSEFNGNTLSAETPFEIYHHTLPFFVIENGSENVNTSFYGLSFDDWNPPTTENELIDSDNAIYVNNFPENQTPHFEGSAVITFIYRGLATTSSQVYNKIRFALVNEDNSIASTLYELDLFIDATVEDSSIAYPIIWDFTPTVEPGQYIVMLCEKWRINDGNHIPMNQFNMENHAIGGFKNETHYNSLFLSITDDSIISDSTHPVLLPHELFANLIAQINGGTFYSEVFGREELGYDVDGEFAYLAITTGELLRGIPLSDVQISTSFREAFSSYSSVICLGAIIEENRIRIDPLDVLFNRNIAANIGEVDDLGITPTKEFLFNSVKCGYPKNEYEEQNGRDEFNTTYQYTNSIQAVKKELDLVSKYYGDGYGIEFARRESIITTGTKDTKYDDKIFFIDLVKTNDEEAENDLDADLDVDLGLGISGTLQSRRNEGILFVDGIFSPTTAINLRIAAGQNMLRWRKYLNVPMDKKEKVYYFQTKDKNASLNLVTELGETVDGQDLQTGSTAYFKPEYRNFNCGITIDTLFAIMANPLGTVQYTYEGEKFFDYLFEVEAETDKGQAQWRMLGTKDSPVQTMVLPEAALNILKWGPGLDDYLKWGPGPDDYLLYQ